MNVTPPAPDHVAALVALWDAYPIDPLVGPVELIEPAAIYQQMREEGL